MPGINEEFSDLEEVEVIVKKMVHQAPCRVLPAIQALPRWQVPVIS